jgi:hypothetical protein
LQQQIETGLISRSKRARRIDILLALAIDEPGKPIAAQWLAYAHPCQRFAEALAGNRA